MGDTAMAAWRLLRGPISLTAALLLFVSNGIAQTSYPPPIPAAESDFTKWALTQGGLVIVLIAGGWSYRRDLIGIINKKDEISEDLLNIVKENTHAVTELALLIREIKGSR